MSEHLCVTVRFLGGTFHGRADRGEPEWPPSPLRLFQALVAGAAARWNERIHLQTAAPALRWLEARSAPIIVAPRTARGEKYRLYVPSNIGDKVARAWMDGGKASAAENRPEKDVRPTRLLDGDAVHYLWPLFGEQTTFQSHREILFAAADSISHLGWGTDMVVAQASVLSEVERAMLIGRWWQPSAAVEDTALRIPVVGTLDDIACRHTAFLHRISGGNFTPVPPLSRFDVRGYADSAAPRPPPVAAFGLLQPDASGYRIFDPVREGMIVAGMLRHAAGSPEIADALGWDEQKVARSVLGHGEARGENYQPFNGPRVAFLPLPSLEARRGSGEFVVGSIRRVLLAGINGQNDADVQDLARLLSGRALFTEQEPDLTTALLSRLPNSEAQVQRYVARASVWTTVTPVILPGHDDRSKYRARLFTKNATERTARSVEQEQEWFAKLDARTEALLRKAILQAGFSEELAQHAELSWRSTGFCRGVALASEYTLPHKLRRFRCFHVRIAWRDAVGESVAVPGPLCLGSGRFVGTGLFCGLQ